MEIEFGNVEIADIFALENKLQKYAQYVLIHKAILKEKLIIIKKNESSFFYI